MKNKIGYFYKKNGIVLRQCRKYAASFFLVVLLGLGLLCLSAMIPRSKIQPNVLRSAEYLCENELFEEKREGIKSSKVDRYADSILLAIAYQYDSEKPLSSVMRSAYYYSPTQNENENLLEAVTKELEANQQYLRYWHGSIAIVRPLLVFLDLQQIYCLNGVLLAVLVLALLLLLLKEKAYLPMIGVLASLIVTSVWYVPFSLEYTWTYLLMLLFSLIGLKLIHGEHWNLFGVFFMCSGMITNYLDFLTAETLTLTVPLLLMLWMDRKWESRRKSNRGNYEKKAIKAAAAWALGYGGMWIMKWILASLILKENAMHYVTNHIEERIGGNLNLGFWEYIQGAVTKNINCLFPLEYGVMGCLVFGGVVFSLIYFSYVYHRKHICRSLVCVYAGIGCIPYIRYAVLHNHSYLHFFFTYRAQMAAVLAGILIAGELVGWREYNANVRRRES